MSTLRNLNKYRIAPATAFPENILMEVTRACSLRCGHCRRTAGEAGGSGESMAPEVLDKVMPLFAQADMAGLSGWGEALASPMVWPTLQAATRVSINPCLTTNGTLLGEDNCRRLVESGLGQVTVSLDAGTPELFRQVRPGADFGEVIAGIRRLAGLRDALVSVTPYIAISFNFREATAADFPAFIRLAAELPILKAAIHPHYPPEIDHGAPEWRLTPQAVAHYQEGVALAGELGIALEVRLRSILDRQLGLPNRESEGQRYLPTREAVEILRLFPTCRCAWDFPFIDCAGNVYPCGIYPEPFGNVRESSFAEVWDNERFIAFRRALVSWEPPEFCLRCYKTMWYPNRIDEEIPAHLPMSAEGLVGLGWYAPEKLGLSKIRWSRGASTVYVRNTGNPLLYIVAWGLDATRIEVAVNGRELGQLTVLPQWDVYTIPLPVDISPVLRVSFRCLDPRNDPAARFANFRLRLLGIAVGQIGTCKTAGDEEPRRVMKAIMS